MSATGRFIVDAIVLEHRSPTQLARDHKISRRWIYKLVERFKEGGYPSLEPHSRRPRSCSTELDVEIQKLIVKLRCELSAAGHDAGPQTIHYHLAKQVANPPSVTTVWRALKRQGLITPQPHKRSRSSFCNYYNQVRPHRAPAVRPRSPSSMPALRRSPLLNPPSTSRVRRDQIDAFGKVTLRYQGKLRHIPVGTLHKNRKVRLLVAGPDVRIITEAGELIRALTLDPNRNYQPMGGRWPAHNVLQQGCTLS
ncbi:MAG: helix-turn-helix domain-containing protein [Candidatus Dormibacteraceae bacterium]